MKRSNSEYISDRVFDGTRQISAAMRERLIENGKIAAERVADRRAGSPASVKIIQRAAELRRLKDE